MKIIVFNGPPRCGKDTIAETYSHYSDVVLEKFAFPIKDTLKHMFRLSEDEFYKFENNIDNCKDTPYPRFFDKSWRQVQIDFSESYMKPLYGIDVFGQLLKQRIWKYQNTDNKILISDSGFENELFPLIEEFGAHNILIVQIFRDGCDYSKDSRKYLDRNLIPYDDINIVRLENNSSLEDYIKKGRKIVNDF